LGIAGGVLLAVVVALTFLVAGYMSRSQVAVAPTPPAASPVAPAATSPAPQSGVPAAPPPPPAATSSPAPAHIAAATPSPAPASPAAPVSTPSLPVPQVMDVLRQINPARDFARGAWKFQGTGLASPRNEPGVLRLPVTPSTAYRLTLVVERMSSSPSSSASSRRSRTTVPWQPSPRMRPPMSRSRIRPAPQVVPQTPGVTPETPQPQPENSEELDIVLSVDGHPVALVLDGSQRNLSGLELIDGRSVDENGTAFRGEVLPGRRLVTVVCTVGPGSLDATADGRSIVHWNGPSDQLAIDPDLASDVGNGLALVSSTQFRVQRIEIMPLGGTTLPSGPPAVAAAPGAATAYPASPAASATAAPSAEILKSVALIEHPLGSGSGFAIGKKLLATNAHVVEGVFPDEIKVRLGTETGKPQPIARVVYFDRARDLSILELKSDPPGLPIRDDYVFHVGDRVTLIGNPSAGGGIVMRNAVNHGRLSSVVHIKNEDFYQIEATVNPGWSGGPVLDPQGKVIAVVAMKADDRAVTLIRGAEQKLDQGFRTRVGRTAYGTGLTFGIPASALGSVLNDPGLHNEARQAEASDKCAAKTLTDRLNLLAELAMLRVIANVPVQVRNEARTGITRTLTGVKRTAVAPGDAVPIPSEADAARLNQLLEDERVKSVESIFRNRLDARISAVRESEYLSDSVKRDLEALVTKIRDVNKFADHPSTTYNGFNTKVKGFSHDFKEHFKRLEENLKDKETEGAGSE
jgi:S1-C subfamily serine protease